MERRLLATPVIDMFDLSLATWRERNGSEPHETQSAMRQLTLGRRHIRPQSLVLRVATWTPGVTLPRPERPHQQEHLVQLPPGAALDI
jgi:hypothetical protein